MDDAADADASREGLPSFGQLAAAERSLLPPAETGGPETRNTIFPAGSTIFPAGSAALDDSEPYLNSGPEAATEDAAAENVLAGPGGQHVAHPTASEAALAEPFETIFHHDPNAPPENELHATPDAPPASGEVAIEVIPRDETPTEQEAVRAMELAQASGWPTASTLCRQLDDLAVGAESPARAWAQRAKRSLEQLDSIDELGDPRAGGPLASLRALAAESEELAAKIEDRRLRSMLLRAGYGIARRTVIWEKVHEIVTALLAPPAPAAELRVQTQRALAAVEAVLAEQKTSREWRRYLLLDAMRDCLARAGDPSVDPDALVLSRRSLLRIENPAASEEQREFLRQPAIFAYDRALRRLNQRQIDFPELLARIEHYEAQSSEAAANELAEAWRALAYSPHPQHIQLAKRLDVHYRNANIRLTLSEGLLSRLAPAQPDLEEPVAEYILGARVRGRSRVQTQVSVQLIPDPTQLQLGLEASGDIASRTASRVGPVTFFSRSRSNFVARKLLLVGTDGVRVTRARAVANTASALTSLATEYDDMPLLGSIVRNSAKSQHDEQRYLANQEVESRIARRSAARFDEAIHAELTKAENRFVERILTPLIELGLDPGPTDLHTTEDQMVVRYRLAGYDQLAAQTPRPTPPPGSVASLQAHESSLNNVLDHIELAGKQFSIHELYAEIGEALQGKAWTPPEDVPHDVLIRFAESEPVRVRFREGAAELTIRLGELRQGSHQWENFDVMVTFQPTVQGLRVGMVREGVIKLAGERLRMRDQIALRGVFSKVFAKGKAIEIVSESAARDARFDGLAISQVVLVDGWLGVAARDTVEMTAAKPQPTRRE